MHSEYILHSSSDYSTDRNRMLLFGTWAKTRLGKSSCFFTLLRFLSLATFRSLTQIILRITRLTCLTWCSARLGAHDVYWRNLYSTYTSFWNLFTTPTWVRCSNETVYTVQLPTSVLHYAFVCAKLGTVCFLEWTIVPAFVLIHCFLIEYCFCFLSSNTRVLLVLVFNTTSFASLTFSGLIKSTQSSTAHFCKQANRFVDALVSQC